MNTLQRTYEMFIEVLERRSRAPETTDWERQSMKTVMDMMKAEIPSLKIDTNARKDVEAVIGSVNRAMVAGYDPV